MSPPAPRSMLTRSLGFLASKHAGNGAGRLLLYELATLSTALASMALYRWRAYHAHRVPQSGPLLIAANHESFLDPPLIGIGFTHRHAEFIARKTLFSFRPLGALISALNSIPVDQEQSDTAAIRETLARLNAGAAIMIFPEGSRTSDGEMDEFKRGVAVLLKRARCPVVPAAIRGPFKIWPRSRAFPKPWGRVSVAYGHPIPPEVLLQGGGDGALQRLRTEIGALRDELAEREARAVRTIW